MVVDGEECVRLVLEQSCDEPANVTYVNISC